MKNQSHTIRKIVSFINNPEENGGFWLPNIQRPFVWREEQIERLFDSIMRQYPISTLLVWKTKSEIRHRKFIDNYKSSLRLSDFFVPENGHSKCLVLDGQQRLQSVFIGLKGSYEAKELFFDILSGDIAAPDDIRYVFKFREDDGDPRWVKVKSLVFSDERDNRITRHLIDRFNGELPPDSEDRIEDNVSQISNVFKQTEVVVYQELDSIECPSLYADDDVVEIFIRANSGGTLLGKSDLLFSLLSSSWEESDEQMEDLLAELNKTGYGFTRDFVLKTCLTLLNTGAKYNVAKFRDPENREKIITNWDKISEAICDVKDFLYGKTFIRSDKALSSYLGLIPIIYCRYHFEEAWSQANDLATYVLRTLLSGTFSSSPDSLVDACNVTIREIKGWDTKKLFATIRNSGRPLEITPETLLEQGYGSKMIHLLFNLWYRDFNYHPSYENNSPQIDHVFPKSLLRKIKKENPETGRRTLQVYKKPEQDQLGNCMLLTAEENGAGGKRDIPPDEWFADKDDAYLDMHLIPKDPELWKIERFTDFIRERNKLIKKKFSYLTISSKKQ